MEHKHTEESNTHKRILSTNHHNSLVPGLQVTFSRTMTQSTPTGSGGDTAQSSSLLGSEFCELASKFDRESLIKVDSMLAHPCRYLEEVPIFEIDETDGEVQHNDLSDTNVGLTERMSILDTAGLDSSTNFEARTEESSGILADVEESGEPKETKMDLLKLNSAPFLVSEEGVMFQCFPISEKEVIIVSLDDNSLLINDSLTGHVTASSEPDSVGGTSHLRIYPANSSSTEDKLNIEKTDSPVHHIDVPASGTGNHDNVSSTIILTNNKHEGSCNAPSCGTTELAKLTRNSATIHTKHINEVITSSLPPDVMKNIQVNATVNRKRKLSIISEDVPEGPRKEAKITHATIYAPFHRKPRTVAADPEEQGSSEWFRCTMCTDVLPSAATLRHHLVKQHQQQDIKSFMCFLCKHECWSESQQEWHLRVHHGIKNKAVACSVCGTQLSTSAECKAHVRKHLATLACPSCSRKFSAQHQLVAHAKQHLEQLRPHSCLMCGARFTHCGVLQVHSWHHRPQKCPQEECEHIAEDESWLVVHLQNQHKLTGKQIHSIISPRDASDRRMDILLDKYSSLCENPLALLNSYKVDDYLTLENLSFSPNAVSGVQPRRNKNVVDLESSSVRQSEATDSEDCDIFKNIVNCLVEAVAGVEEEEKKAVRREEEVLQKVMEEGPTLYRCGLCNIYLPSAEELATHKAGHNQAIICLKCQKSFLSVKQLKRHMTVHSSQDTSQQGADKNKVMPEHRCLECGKTCGSESALSRHRGTHARSLGRHQCQTCKRRVRTRAHLIEHMARVHKINHESKKLQCSMCDRKFTTKTHLESHLVSHGEKEPLWSCDKCGRNYVRPRSLQRHMATHDFKFACSNCDETFMSARRLAIHARTHDPSHKTKLSCPKCPQRYAYASQLQVHMRIHTGEKPYVCETCGKCFKRLQQCRAHHRMIHGNHKEACLECGKTFGDKTNLLRHRLMVHHHLKRWVCGVCAQSYAYSQDLRNHLQKQHNLAFERLDGTNKKSRHEVYVVPEMGSQDLNPIMEQAVESVCSLERRKVQQVLCGFSGTVRKTRKSGSENAEEVDNPDDPTSLQDSPLAIASLAVNDPPPTQETPLRATSILVPSATISIPTVIENSHIQPEHKGGQNVTATVEGEVQGFVRVSGVTCAECGVEATTPLQCGPCGALMCSQTHLDLHVASNHHVMFQCSVCGLHYGSQADCVAHVTAVHSSHLLAVQGGAATYLTPQSSQPIQINNGGNMQSQICMPLNNSQSTPQCLLQVGDRSPQVPLIIAPTTANVTTQQLETNNVILQYPNVNVLPAGFSAVPHSTALNPTKNQEKQAVFTMTGFLAGPQQTHPKHQRKVSHVLDKQEKQPSLCTITIPNSSDGGVLLPAGDSAAVNLSVGQNTAMLPAILPHQTSNGENSAFIMGNAGIGTTQNDSAPVLLMGSLPFNSVSTGSTTLLPQPKPCNLNNQANTSMASVLLTLAEPSHNDPMSSFMPSESSRVADEQVKQHSPSSVLVNNLPLQKTVEEQSNTEDSSNLLQSIVGLPVPDEEGIHGPTSSALHDTLVTEDQAEEEGMTQNPVHEVSVEIIQTRPRRSKAESQTKHYWEKEASQAPRDADNELPNNSGVDPSYQCSTCGKNFQTSAHLERHQRTHDSQKFRCQVCDKAFTEKYNLKTHMLTHTRARPHVCSQCFKSFRYMRDLTEHKRTHEGSRPHVCKICEKCFVRRRDYTRHFREQHGTQRHQCKICGSSFKRRVYLETVHMRTHQPQTDQVPQEGNNPVQKATHSKETKEAKESHMCNICGRTFARARYLTSHLRTHSRRADYVRCPRCPRMFTSEQTLKVHKEAFHDRETTSTRGFNNSDFDDVDQKPVTEESFFPEVHKQQPKHIKGSRPSMLHQTSASSSGVETSHSILMSSQLQSLSPEVTCELLHPSSQVMPSEHQSHHGTHSHTGEELERSDQQGMMSLSVHMEDCVPINYLTPSFSSP